ncbi:TonB-dependent receptor [Zhongshania sp. BJYM1]|uniref:TonB-dependent receptor n=1 Tax=Zhongshania aquatica TaxID=2965069 RepID=UPI0022B320C6|nr:TonB-dependent receptor [Marortus sp. BJYM1]
MNNNNYSIRSTVRPYIFSISAAVLAPVELTYAAQLEEVIVTAQKRAEDMQTVPVSVSALTADQLADIGFNDISDIAAQVPSLIVLTNISPLATTFRIRNIGNAGNIPNFEPATGLFIDGAFRSRSGIGMGDLVDVSSVEVLKGPQSTLHGKNVTAGVISVATQGPTENVEAMAEVSFGSDNLKQIKAYISGPFTDSIAGRLSLVDTGRSELIDNVAGPKSEGLNGYAIRGQLRMDFSESLYARLIVGYADKDMNTTTGDVFLSDAMQRILRNAGASLTIPNDPSDRLIEYSEGSGYIGDSNDVIFTMEYSGDGYSLTSISSYDDYDGLTYLDDVEQASLLLADFKDRQAGESYSQEFRIASDTSGPFSWLGGVFLYTNEFRRGDKSLPEFIAQKDVEAFGGAVAGELASRGLLPINLGSLPLPLLGVEGDRGDYYITQNTDSFGIFTKLDYEFSDAWKAAFGLRYSYEDKTGVVNQTAQLSALGCIPPLNTNLICLVTPDGNNFNQSKSFDAITGSLSTSYFVNEDTMFYGVISTGFKAGGFSLQNGTATDDMRPFGEEEVINFELGAKTEFLDRRARVNASIFHTEYKNFQNASFAGLVFIINNADLVTVDGIEVDSTVILTENLSTTINFAYIDTVFDSYDGGQCYYGREPDNDLGQCRLDGEELPSATKFKGNIALNWRYPLASGDLYSRLDYAYTGEANASSALDPRFDQPASNTLNLRLGWRTANIDIAFWGRNITDEVHIDQVAPANIFTTIDSRVNSPVGSYQAFTNQPRSLGLTARYTY